MGAGETAGRRDGGKAIRRATAYGARTNSFQTSGGRTCRPSRIAANGTTLVRSRISFEGARRGG